MPHRSDEEALRAKLEERERELQEAEQRLRRAEEENQRLRSAREPAPNRSPPGDGRRHRARPQLALLAGLVTVLVLGLGAALFVLAARPADVHMAPYPPPMSSTGTASSPPVPPMPAVPVPPPFTVHLGARVTGVSGSTPVRVGDTCDVVATLTSYPRLTLDDVSVSCAGTHLYAFSDPIAGISMSSTDAFAWPGNTPGTLRYQITVSDTGERSMRAQALLDSWTGASSIFSTGLGAFRVELELEPTSDDVPEPPLSPIAYVPSLPPHASRHGRVVSSEVPGLTPGTECRVVVRPSPGSPTLNTRTHVRCGTTILYGAGTAGLARQVGDVVTDADVTPVDGDPAMTLDLAAGTLHVRDERAGRSEAVEIALDPAPAALPVPPIGASGASPPAPAAPPAPPTP